MTFKQAVRSALSQYATFSGRARRAEYWWFYLFTILVALATSVVDAILNTAFDNEIGVVGTITSLALFLPTLSVTARRLHDTSRTAWWMLLPVIPVLATLVVGFATLFAVLFNDGTDGSPAALIGLLVLCVVITLVACVVLLVFLCRDSTPGPNKYGPSPKQPPMLPTGPAGYFTPGGYGAYPAGPDPGNPYGNPQLPPAPPAPGSYTPRP